jgi:phosphoribosylglycinamide formyltransferase-1
MNTHARVLEAGEAEHGCTVHLVVEEVDSGETLDQSKTPVLPGDTPESLAERVLALEHELYPRCLAEFARSRP